MATTTPPVNGVTGFGVSLGFAPAGTGPSGPFTFLATVMSITPIKSTVPKADATLLNSKVKVANRGTPELTAGCKVRYDPSDPNIKLLETETWSAGYADHDFQIKDLTGASRTWTGFIESFEREDLEPDNTRTATLGFVINTVPIDTPAPAGS